MACQATASSLCSQRGLVAGQSRAEQNGAHCRDAGWTEVGAGKCNYSTMKFSWRGCEGGDRARRARKLQSITSATLKLPGRRTYLPQLQLLLLLLLRLLLVPLLRPLLCPLPRLWRHLLGQLQDVFALATLTVCSGNTHKANWPEGLPEPH